MVDTKYAIRNILRSAVLSRSKTAFFQKKDRAVWKQKPRGFALPLHRILEPKRNL
jgi:hypothetical protein